MIRLYKIFIYFWSSGQLQDYIKRGQTKQNMRGQFKGKGSNPNVVNVLSTMILTLIFTIFCFLRMTFKDLKYIHIHRFLYVNPSFQNRQITFDFFLSVSETHFTFLLIEKFNGEKKQKYFEWNTEHFKSFIEIHQTSWNLKLIRSKLPFNSQSVLSLSFFLSVFVLFMIVQMPTQKKLCYFQQKNIYLSRTRV